MLAEFPALVPRLVGNWAGWVGRRKLPAAILAGGVACLIFAGALLARSGARAPLFEQPLHASQSEEVAQTLAMWAEPFWAGPQTGQIYVPAARRRDVALRLRLAGLPHRYVATSSDVLETPQNPLLPQAVIDDRRRSGIEGDLIAGLRRISGVADATVLLSPVQPDAFAADGRTAPSSASVQLIMQPGMGLSPLAISGVKRFIAAAYPGLAPDRIAVVDGSGALQEAPALMDRALSRERRVQTAVQSALDAVLGDGVAVVRVDVRASGVEQSTQSTRVVPHGLLDDDTGHYRGSERGGSFDKEKTNRHFAYDTVLERRASHPDTAGRMSIAVFLDAGRVPQRTLAAISGLVRAAAGADLRAGDQVAVQTLPFARAARREIAAERPNRSVKGALLPAAAACALAIVGLALWPRLQPRHACARNPDDDDSAAASIKLSLRAELPHTTAYVLGALPPRLRGRVLRSYEPGMRAAIESHMPRRQA